MLHAVIPVLRIADIGRTLEFYCQRLGFRREFLHQAAPSAPAYGGIALDGHAVHLSTFDGGVRMCLQLRIDDVDALYERLRGQGMFAHVSAADLARDPVHCRPTDQTWGLRELVIEDPDGHILVFASPIATPL